MIIDPSEVEIVNRNQPGEGKCNITNTRNKTRQEDISASTHDHPSGYPVNKNYIDTTSDELYRRGW